MEKPAKVRVDLQATSSSYSVIMESGGNIDGVKIRVNSNDPEPSVGFEALRIASAAVLAADVEIQDSEE